MKPKYYCFVINSKSRLRGKVYDIFDYVTKKKIYDAIVRGILYRNIRLRDKDEFEVARVETASCGGMKYNIIRKNIVYTQIRVSSVKWNLFKFQFKFNGIYYSWKKYEKGVFEYQDVNGNVAFSLKRKGIFKTEYLVEVNEEFEPTIALIIVLLIDHIFRSY